MAEQDVDLDENMGVPSAGQAATAAPETKSREPLGGRSVKRGRSQSQPRFDPRTQAKSLTRSRSQHPFRLPSLEDEAGESAAASESDSDEDESLPANAGESTTGSRSDDDEHENKRARKVLRSSRSDVSESRAAEPEAASGAGPAAPAPAPGPGPAPAPAPAAAPATKRDIKRSTWHFMSGQDMMSVFRDVNRNKTAEQLEKDLKQVKDLTVTTKDPQVAKQHFTQLARTFDDVYGLIQSKQRIAGSGLSDAVQESLRKAMRINDPLRGYTAIPLPQFIIPIQLGRTSNKTPAVMFTIPGNSNDWIKAGQGVQLSIIPSPLLVAFNQLVQESRQNIAAIKSLEGVLSRANDARNSLEKELFETRAAKVAASELSKGLAEQVDIKTKENATLTSELKAALAQVGQTSRDLGGAVGAASTIVSETLVASAELKAAREDIKKLRDELKAAQDEVETKSNELDGAKKTIQTLNLRSIGAGPGELKRLRDVNGQLEQKIVDLTNDLKHAQDRANVAQPAAAASAGGGQLIELPSNAKYALRLVSDFEKTKFDIAGLQGELQNTAAAIEANEKDYQIARYKNVTDTKNHIRVLLGILQDEDSARGAFQFWEQAPQTIRVIAALTSQLLMTGANEEKARPTAAQMASINAFLNSKRLLQAPVTQTALVVGNQQIQAESPLGRLRQLVDDLETQAAQAQQAKAAAEATAAVAQANATEQKKINESQQTRLLTLTAESTEAKRLQSAAEIKVNDLESKAVVSEKEVAEMKKSYTEIRAELAKLQERATTAEAKVVQQTFKIESLDADNKKNISRADAEEAEKIRQTKQKTRLQTMLRNLGRAQTSSDQKEQARAKEDIEREAAQDADPAIQLEAKAVLELVKYHGDIAVLQERLQKAKTAQEVLELQAEQDQRRAKYAEEELRLAEQRHMQADTEKARNLANMQSQLNEERTRLLQKMQALDANYRAQANTNANATNEQIAALQKELAQLQKQKAELIDKEVKAGSEAVVDRAEQVLLGDKIKDAVVEQAQRVVLYQQELTVHQVALVAAAMLSVSDPSTTPAGVEPRIWEMLQALHDRARAIALSDFLGVLRKRQQEAWSKISRTGLNLEAARSSQFLALPLSEEPASDIPANVQALCAEPVWALGVAIRIGSIYSPAATVATQFMSLPGQERTDFLLAFKDQNLKFGPIPIALWIWNVRLNQMFTGSDRQSNPWNDFQVLVSVLGGSILLFQLATEAGESKDASPGWNEDRWQNLSGHHILGASLRTIFFLHWQETRTVKDNISHILETCGDKARKVWRNACAFYEAKLQNHNAKPVEKMTSHYIIDRLWGIFVASAKDLRKDTANPLEVLVRNLTGLGVHDAENKKAELKLPVVIQKALQWTAPSAQNIPRLDWTAVKRIAHEASKLLRAPVAASAAAAGSGAAPMDLASSGKLKFFRD